MVFFAMSLNNDLSYGAKPVGGRESKVISMFTSFTSSQSSSLHKETKIEETKRRQNQDERNRMRIEEQEKELEERNLQGRPHSPTAENCIHDRLRISGIGNGEWNQRRGDTMPMQLF